MPSDPMQLMKSARIGQSDEKNLCGGISKLSSNYKDFPAAATVAVLTKKGRTASL